MRKVKLQMQTTLDGFVARPDGQMDWMSVEMDSKQLTVLQGADRKYGYDINGPENV